MPQVVAQVLIGLAVSALLGALSRALSPKPKKASTKDRGRKQVVRSSIEEHQVIYGTSLESGPLVFVESTGSNNEFLHLVVALAAHEVEGIDSVWLNDVEVTNGQLDGSGNVTSGKFSGSVRIKKLLGTDTQVADSDLVSEVTNWTSSHRGRGIAYVYLRLKWSQDVFPTGIPNIRAVVRGRKVWDPRLNPGDPSVRAFSNNAALCQLDYLMSSFGFVVPLGEINEASWIAAANVSDEDVSLQAGGTQDRYTCDGSFQVDKKPAAIMEELLTASAGTMVYQQGTFRGYAGVATTATNTLDDSDLRGLIDVAPRPSLSDSFNAIRGTFVDADDAKAPFSLTDFPPITNATFESEDGGERVFNEIDLPFTTNKTRAQRIATLFLLRARQGIIAKFPAKLNKLEIAAWDVVTVTNTLLAWSAKEFRVIEWELSESGGVDLTLQEEASSVYDFDSADEIILDPAPDTNLPDPFNAIAPTGLTLISGTAALFLKADGTVTSRIKLSWTAPVDQFVTSGGKIEVQFKKSADSIWEDSTSVPGDQVETFVSPVEDGVAYDARIRSVNTLAVKSSFITVTGHIVIGKTAVPADVTGFTAAQNGDVMNFRWTQVADVDLQGYEIRFGSRTASPTYADATPLTKVTRGTAITSALIPPGDWTLFIKAVDTSGNESVNAGSFDAIMVNTFDVILEAEQSPEWSNLNNGTGTDFIKHHTGVLVPDSQDLASVGGFDVFDIFVRNPVVTAIYEAPEQDISFDDTARIFAEILSALGPGETVGTADPQHEIDHRLDSGAYDGFEAWSVGSVAFRFVKQRLVLTTANGVAKITGFNPTIDLKERIEGANSVVIGAGGTAITFAQQFHETPLITVTVDSASALIATKAGVSTTGFTAHVFNTSGTEVGGTIDWEATGA